MKVGLVDEQATVFIDVKFTVNARTREGTEIREIKVSTRKNCFILNDFLNQFGGFVKTFVSLVDNKGRKHNESYANGRIKC